MGKSKKKVNYEKLYIIMCDRVGLIIDEIKSLKNIKCKKLIVLSENFYSDISYVKTIKQSNKDRANVCTYLDKDMFGFGTFEKN